MNNLMLDIETMGTNSYSPIVQIGACYFDLNTGKIGEVFKHNVKLKSSMDLGMVVTPSTISWWMRQSQDAIKSVFQDISVDIRKALLDFASFAINSNSVWSHATFDFVVLMNHFSRAGVVHDIKYWEARDVRTLVHLYEELNGKKFEFPKRIGTHHDALADAKYQAHYCHLIYKELFGG